LPKHIAINFAQASRASDAEPLSNTGC